MATDYDAPRKNEDEVAEDSIEELKSRRNDAGSAEIEEDENEAAENFELPGADLSKEELTVHRRSPPGRRVHLLAVLPRAPRVAARPRGRQRRPRVHRVRDVR